MTPKKKPQKSKPDPTRNARQSKRNALQEAAALRDGFESRSAALTAWMKGEARLVRVVE